MKIVNSLTLLLLVFSMAGCLKFGDDEETSSPTKKQINKCRSVMYLNPSIKINPIGYKFHGSGMDDAIWFKFKTDAEKVKDIFNPQVVDTSVFKEDFKINNISTPKWWQTEHKTFLGGQIELPNVKFMNVGIEKSDEGYVVYIMWHEV